MSTAQTGRTHDLHPTASKKPKKSLDPWAPSTHDPIRPRAMSTYCGATIVVPLPYEARFLSTSDVIRSMLDTAQLGSMSGGLQQSGESDHEASFPKCRRGASSAIGPSVCAGAAADDEMRVGSADGCVRGV